MTKKRAAKKKAAKKATKKKARAKTALDPDRVDLATALAWLEKKGTAKQVHELERYGIAATEPYGVAVGELKKVAKTIGTDHELALGLWDTGRYEARMLAAMVDDPTQVTVSQMNAWVADFDNWAIVDTVCFHLFDRTKHAWKKVPGWARAKPEFTKRTAFALIWSLTVHDKQASDRAFQDCLPLVERAANDDRPLVKKAVNMALRAIGKRNAALNTAAIATAERLAVSEDRHAQWVGRHAAKELKSPAVRKRLAQRG